MTNAFDTATDPAEPARGRALVPYRAPPRRAARLFRWWLGLGLVAFCAVAVCALLGFNHSDIAPLHIVIDGDDVSDGITINGLDALGNGGRALFAFGAAALALLLVLVIPLVMLLVIGSVAIALVCGIGVPLVVLALALGVVTSPFWMVALFVWLLNRRRRDAQRAAGSATMAA